MNKFEADVRFLGHIRSLQASLAKTVAGYMGPLPMWKVYMVRCSDGSLYTGVTTDINRRIHEHNKTKKGSKYCRSRRPVKLAYVQGDFENRAHAQQREREIKRLSKKEKEALISKGHREAAN